MINMDKRIDPRVTVRDGEMKAFIRLEKKTDGSVYTREEVMDILKEGGVVSGISESRLMAMIRKNMYGIEIQVAEGIPPQDGQDGYVEFLNGVADKKTAPEIRPDGSVDYTSVNVINSVSEGDLLAVYHPPVEGRAGVTVKGRKLLPRRGRNMKPLSTRGCTYNEEDMTYIADISGKVEISRTRISVVGIQEFNRSIDSVFGDISFKGDVLIHGNVQTGVTITATRSITINGVVESANINAGGDIIVKGGIRGAKATKIECGGDLFADYIEYARIRCKGSVSANVILDCDVTANSCVHATGGRGAIIGGRIYAMAGVDAMFIGNDAFLRTVVAVGVGEGIRKERRRLSSNMGEITDAMYKLQLQSEAVEHNIRMNGSSEELIEARQAILRSKIEADAQLSETTQKLNAMEDYIAKAEGAQVTVMDTVYPGCIILLDEQQLYIEDEKRRVEFIRDRYDNLVAHPIPQW